MSSYAEYESQHLQHLRSEGLFVRILGEADFNCCVKVECSIYITDIDDETGTINILQVHEDEPLRSDEHGLCVACRAEEDEVRPTVRGSVECPLCGVQTTPWYLRKRTYSGTFIVGGSGAPALVDADLSGGRLVMPPEMAAIVGEQLRWLEVAFESSGDEVVTPSPGGYDSEEEEPPVNFADFYPPLVSPFEAEDNAARYTERYGFVDSP
jgi:hypothetical protein